MAGIGRRMLALGRSAVAYPINSTFGDAWMDLTGLRLGSRALVYGGYLVIGLAIGLLFVQQMFLSRFASLLTARLAIHDAVSVFLTLAGWGFLLTAGVLSRRRIGLAVVLLFALSLSSHVWAVSSLLVLVLFLLVLALALAVLLVPPLRVLAVRWPLLYFAATLTLLGLLAAVDGTRTLADGTLVSMAIQGVILVIYLVSGLALLNLGVTVGRSIVEWLSRRFRPAPFAALLLTLLFVRFALANAILILARIVTGGDQAQWQSFISANLHVMLFAEFEAILLIPIFIWLLVLALTKRWNSRTLSLVFVVSMLSVVISIGAAFAVQNTDITDLTALTVERLNLLPPFMTFIIFLTATLLSFGSSFAATNGRFIPRNARIIAVIGAVLLILANMYAFERFTIIGFSEISELWVETVALLQSVLYVIGLLLLTGPYFIFLLARRRPTFVGTAGLVTPAQSIWPWMDRVAPQRLLGATAVVGLMVVGLCCGSQLMSRLLFAF